MNPELKDALEAMERGLSTFKRAHTEELAAVKADLADVELMLSRGQPVPATGHNHSPSTQAAMVAGGDYFRTGDLAQFRAAAQIGIDPDGGLLVPREISREIERLVRDRSAMRGLARVRPAQSSPLVLPVDRRGATSGWVGETEARPETATPDLATTEIHLREVYANPAVTQQLLDVGTSIDIAGWLTESIAEELADAEGTAFVTGDGVKRPRGYLTHPTAATPDSSRPRGTLQHGVTGAAASFATASATVSPADALVDLVHSLRAGYRQGAAWMMNSATAARVRKFKDVDGRFVWSPSLQEGQPSLLLGYPVVEEEAMPDVAADALPIAFGNWRRGYTIADWAGGIRILRDALTRKPFVQFYSTKLVGGDVTNFEAIKLLKVSA